MWPMMLVNSRVQYYEIGATVIAVEWDMYDRMVMLLRCDDHKDGPGLTDHYVWCLVGDI